MRPLRLFVGAAREALPLVPTGDGFGEATHRDERKAELAMRRGKQRIEPQRAPQLLGGGGPVSLRQMNPAEQYVNRRIVRLHAPRLLGGGARGVEVLGLQRPLGLGDELGQVGRAARTAPLCRPGVHEHDHAGTFKTEQRLGHLEVRTSELRGQPTDGSLAVDERTNSLVLTDTPPNLTAAAGILDQLDTRTREVLIEMKFVEFNTADVRKLRNLGFEPEVRCSMAMAGERPSM